MLPKRFYLLLTFVFTIVLLLPAGQSGPVPKVNEHDLLLPKVPQWHCLRYFKHDILMKRRCRHLHIPTSSRWGDEKKLKNLFNYNVVERTNKKRS